MLVGWLRAGGCGAPASRWASCPRRSCGAAPLGGLLREVGGRTGTGDDPAVGALLLMYYDTAAFGLLRCSYMYDDIAACGLLLIGCLSVDDC